MAIELPHIILASKSPRRRALLDAAHVDYELLEIDVDESFPGDIPVDEVAEYLALKKAKEAIKLRPEKIILTADSVVIQNGQIYEKPADRDDALHIIRQLAGKTHYVITGVCLISKDSTVSFADRADVWMEEMTDTEIEFYVDEFHPFDKAGAYGIQDWIGVTKVKRIHGSYHTIMGLPVHRVYSALRAWDI